MSFLFLQRRIKTFILLSFVVYLLPSCALIVSQVKMTRSYYSALNQFGNQCCLLHDQAPLVSYERRLIYPVSYTNDTLMVNELIENYENYSSRKLASDSFTIKVNNLNSYFLGFSSYMPKQSTNTGTQVYDRKVLSAIENFSSYLPFGIGLTIYKTLYDIVSYTARFAKVPHTRKKIKQYIQNGENLIPLNSDIILEEIKKITSETENEKKEIIQNYLKFLKSQDQDKTPIDYYQNYNKIFLRKYNFASSVYDLSVSLSDLIPVMDQTYLSLLNETKKRKRIKCSLDGMQEMNLKLTKVNSCFKALNDAILQNKSQSTFP